MKFLSLLFFPIFLRIATYTSDVSSGEIKFFEGYRLSLIVMVVLNFKVLILGHGKSFECMNRLSTLRFITIYRFLRFEPLICHETERDSFSDLVLFFFGSHKRSLIKNLLIERHSLELSGIFLVQILFKRPLA